MNVKAQGAFRPFVRASRCIAVSLCVMVVSAAYAQRPEPQPIETSPAADTNDKIAKLALAAQGRQSDYVIGSGDSLGIEVFDVPELSREVRVSDSGYIALPLIPTKVRAAGLTTFQLQDKIAELLQTNGLVSTPQVTVTMKEQRSQPISVIGAVKSPVVFQAMRQTTLIEALSRAGGVTDDAGSVILVTRTPQTQTENAPPSEADPTGVAQTFTIGVSDLLDSGDSRFNIPLVGGDVVSVPRAGIVYVVGAVARPGGFLMQNDKDKVTALKALSLAGGANITAKPSEAVILRKNAVTGKRDEVPIDLNKVLRQKGEDPVLETSDILYVPDSTGKRALRRMGDLAISLTTGVAVVRAGR